MEPEFVIYENLQHERITDYYCPVCFESLDIKQEKCEHCGQKIDWNLRRTALYKKNV